MLLIGGGGGSGGNGQRGSVVVVAMVAVVAVVMVVRTRAAVWRVACTLVVRSSPELCLRHVRILVCFASSPSVSWSTRTIIEGSICSHHNMNKIRMPVHHLQLVISEKRPFFFRPTKKGNERAHQLVAARPGAQRGDVHVLRRDNLRSRGLAVPRQPAPHRLHRYAGVL